MTIFFQELIKIVGKVNGIIDNQFLTIKGEGGLVLDEKNI